MKATFQDQLLHHADFLRSWPEVADLSVDLVLADPPYGCLTSSQDWDVQPNFHVVGWILAQLLKLHGQIAIFGDMATAADILLAFTPYFKFRFQWIWQKSSASAKNHTRPAIDIENILVFSRTNIKIKDLTFNYKDLMTPGKPYSRKGGKNQNKNPILKGGGNLPDVYVNEDGRRYPRSILKYPNKPGMKIPERTAHPVQKPVGLISDIIKGLTNPGDLVLDPFAGSSSTLVACHRMVRHGIGFETREDFFKMSCERLSREIK